MQKVRLAAAPGGGLALDLALVLAVDCSSSVDAADFRMQMDGIAAALRNPPLIDAIRTGTHRRIALTLVQWSTRDSQTIAIAWRVIAGRADVEAMARQAETAERQWRPGGTGLAAAVAFSAALLASLPAVASRRVIDVSGDGEDNEGGNAARARDLAVGLGITINGLPIVNGSRQLEPYYRDQVIGGPGSFLMPAKDTRSFADAMTAKLLREVGEAVA
ncbi:MAG: DUF1194 domain-containing protein [Rhizobiales bacterium]|nr:DUF1194 domain-containing protein [Hyphomicrobiales bacterium]MBI3674779.1 DUF1194 domain-containing protein [Hyphomicrobiales bacterium]